MVRRQIFVDELYFVLYKYNTKIAIMDGVKEAGGKTYMFSSLHPSGEHLNNVKDCL